MVDLAADRLSHGRLGMECDAQPRFAQHGKVVCPIAHGHRLSNMQPMCQRQPAQVRKLCVGAKDRLPDLAGQVVALDHQGIGVLFVKSTLFRHAGGKEREPARYQRRVRAMPVHRAHQFPRTGIETYVLPCRLQQSGGHAAQQPDAFTQRGLKIHFPVHGLARDLGNAFTDTRMPCEVIQRFAIDDGAVHVRNQQPLAPSMGGNDDGVEGAARKFLAQGGNMRHVARAGRGARDLDRFACRQDGGGSPPGHVACSGNVRRAERCGVAMRDKDEDVGRGGGGFSHDVRACGRDEIMTQGTETGLRPAVIVAGPTCSGKSALALALARVIGGTIINTDSMQVYRELRILTARPTVAEEALLPHRLYGVLPAAQAGSVAWWREQALHAADEAWRAGRIPIFCGGTGMYFRALTDGLADIPDPPPEIRAEARAAVLAEGGPAIHARLMAVDPETASALRPGDTQRIARAWEVWRATGRGLSWWRTESVLPPLSARFVSVRLSPPRDLLRQAIAARFVAMMENGAVEEVRALLSCDLSPTLPAMRAHGVPELAAMLRGEMSRQDAITRAVQVTAQYTKRQSTWFAHHSLAAEARTCLHDGRITSGAQQMERDKRKIISFVINCIDAGGRFRLNPAHISPAGGAVLPDGTGAKE